MELELVKQLSQYGLLGLVAAVAVWGVYLLWRDLKLSWEQRIIDNHQLVQVIETTNHSYTALAASTESRARATEAVARAQEATAAALQGQINILRKLEEQQSELIRYMDRIIVQADALRQDFDRMDRRRD